MHASLVTALLERYAHRAAPLWVVCQPRSARSALVHALERAVSAKISALEKTVSTAAARVTQLVQMTEEVIGGEQRAWLATSLAAKQLAKAASAAAGEEEVAAKREAAQEEEVAPKEYDPDASRFGNWFDVLRK